MIAAPSTDLAELGSRLQRLENERDILQTLYRYGHAIDYGRRDEWLDCFQPTGSFEITLRGARRSRYEGRDELQMFIERHTAAPAAYHKHLLIEPVVDVVDDDLATAASYFVRLDDDAAGAPKVHGFGRYLDRLTRSSDGRWRFVERIAEIEAFDRGGRPGNWVLT